MSTPKHEAYRPVAVSNGVVEGIHHTFDTTVPFTADDQAMMENYGHVGLPCNRILRMQKQIAALEPITNPYIRAHVDNIREIHKRLSRFTDPRPRFSMEQWQNLTEEERSKQRQFYEVTEAEHADLERADYLWAMIVAIPKVAKHTNLVKGGGKGGNTRAQNYEPEKQLWRETAQAILATRKREPSVRELARLVANSLHPEFSEEKKKQMADSGRKWLEKT
ncbi:MAG: hypothetical protein WA435_07205 [Gallionellaceae bacterium]